MPGIQTNRRCISEILKISAAWAKALPLPLPLPLHVTPCSRCLLLYVHVMFESDPTLQEKIQTLVVEEILREAQAQTCSETNISGGIRFLDRRLLRHLRMLRPDFSSKWEYGRDVKNGRTNSTEVVHNLDTTSIHEIGKVPSSLFISMNEIIPLAFVAHGILRNRTERPIRENFNRNWR